MSKESRRARIRWLEHVLWVLGTWTVLALALVVIAVGSGLANPLLRRLLIERVHALTGAQVEIRTVSVGWFSLDATVRGLVLHGTEPKGTEPLLSVEEARIGLQVDSFWGRKISLKELTLKEPRVHIRVEKNGENNLPVLHTTKSTKPLQETLIDLHVGHLHIADGWILYNNVKKLLALEGGDLNLQVDYANLPGNPLYIGNLSWDSIDFARRHDVPIPANLTAKFSLGREGLTIEQGIVDVGRSHFDIQAKMPNLETAALDYRYRAWLDLTDLRDFFATPQVPIGRIDLRGDGSVANGSVLGKGQFAADNITLRFQDFHSANLTARTTYVLQDNGVLLPDFTVTALGGTVKSRVLMEYAGLKFRAESALERVRLSEITPAIDHAGFPIDALHWDSVVTAQAVSTWHDAFLDFEVNGDLQLSEPEDLKPGHIPVMGDWNLRYRDAASTLDVKHFQFETPTSRGTVVGSLAPKASLLDVHLSIGSLENYKDFIRAISGDKPTEENSAAEYTGSLQWDGSISGPSGGPTFQGHFRGENLKYQQVVLDSFDGDMTFSPEGFAITHGRAQRGLMTAGIDGALQLSDWNFGPDDTWNAEITLDKVPLEGLQQLAGVNYPLHGFLTGNFVGRGTRAQPALTGNFDLADGEAYTVPFNRLRGQLNVLPDEVRLTNAELRFFAPGTEKSGGAGIVTGTVAYRYADKSLTTDLVGASLPLENFRRIRASEYPIGGQITFRMKSSGPVDHPVADGTFRMVDFRVGMK